MSHLSIPVGTTDHHDGPFDAPVTLVEYGDYECPYCGEAYGTIKILKEMLGAQLCFVFRNFPLTQMHPHALNAAAFAEAAALQGKFWAAHDILYENQGALGRRDLARYAAELGLEQAPDRANNDALFQRINADFFGGVRSGVNGTPCLFINGTRYDGPRDAHTLLFALRDAMRNGSQKLQTSR